MNEGSSSSGRARSWPYIVTGALFAGICAWISYNDGLFVARLAGNHGRISYAYPLLPDGLIVLALVALAEAARTGVKRPQWAVAGLVLGAGATLAQNTGAGVAHSVLDAVMDGLIPVFFFIAVEIVLWHVRHARQSQVTAKELAVPGAVPADVLSAARASMAATAAAGNPWSVNQLQQRFPLKRAEAREIWAEFVPERGRGGVSPPPAPAAGRPVPSVSDAELPPLSRARRQSPAMRAAGAVPADEHPAGAPPQASAPAPAGAALNGDGPHG